LAPLGKVGLVSVDMGGGVRLWETGLDSLQRSLQEWRNMIGQEDGRPVQVGVHKADVKKVQQSEVQMNFQLGEGLRESCVEKCCQVEICLREKVNRCLH